MWISNFNWQQTRFLVVIGCQKWIWQPMTTDFTSGYHRNTLKISRFNICWQPWQWFSNILPFSSYLNDVIARVLKLKYLQAFYKNDGTFCLKRLDVFFKRRGLFFKIFDEMGENSICSLLLVLNANLLISEILQTNFRKISDKRFFCQ